MITNDRKQIVLMHPIRINYQLAKWQPDPDKKDEDVLSGGSVGENFRFSLGRGNEAGEFQDANVWDGVPFTVRRHYKNPLWQKIAETYIKFRVKLSDQHKDPVDFFMEVKSNFATLKTQGIDEEKIKEMLQILEASKQNHAKSGIINANALIRVENKLVTAGFVQYQTEESIISFVKKCKKGLCLTEVEYFDRVIPEDVLKKMDKAEEVKVFDNYYILHYDPTKAENIHYTEDEATYQKKKDPIMFGVIRGSDKMYFIADWIDEFCNLTYADILKKGSDFKLKKEKIQ